MTTKEELQKFVNKFGTPESEQIDLLAAFIDDKEATSEFANFLYVVERNMCEEVPFDTEPVNEKVNETNVPTKEQSLVADVSAFFDRSLARAALSRLVELKSEGKSTDKPGDIFASLRVPVDELIAIEEVLSEKQQLEPYGEGEIVCGWYHVFNDGSTAAIALTNARTEDGGPYLDPFLIIPEDKYPEKPNVSLRARRSLATPFEFPYPDGTSRIIEIGSDAENG